MIKLRKMFTVLIIISTLIVGIVVFVFANGQAVLQYVIGEKPKQVDEYVAQFSPHLEILKPKSGTVFPVVLIVPGCLHTVSHNSEWHSFLTDLGYAVVIIDSFAPRGITTTEEMLKKVCTGLSVSGFDRAGDIYATVKYLKTQEWVDQERIAIAGWSHGGWAVMDAMAFRERGVLPRNLTGEAPEIFDSIRKIVLIYPHCGFGTAARGGFVWNQSAEVLQIIAGNDQSVDIEYCTRWSAMQDKDRVRTVVYKDAEHTFDIPSPHNRDPSRFSQEIFDTAKEEVRIFLQE